MDAISLTTIARFWSKVDVGSPNACWNWRAGASTFGHGRFKLSGRLVSPHRFVYEQVNGPIPASVSYHGLVVMHACDNPLCCNPRHLRLGTQRDNVRDQIAKGRKPVGRKSPKFSDEVVAAVRADTRLHHVIAADFGMSTRYVGEIKQGKKRAVPYDDPKLGGEA